MKLIDKEHLWNFLKMFQYGQTSEETSNAVIGCVELLEQEKEVEAIPISWIKHFKEEMKNHIQDSVNQHTYMYDHLID